MIDTGTIEKYILGGEWENQYPQVIEQLLAEVKRLREVVDKQQMQYVSLETAYHNSPSQIEIKHVINLI